MKSLSAFEIEHEAIYTGIATANWDTQYLDVSGKVYNKSIFARIAHFFGFQWNSNIVNTLCMLHGRIRLFEYSYKATDEKLKIYHTMALKVSELIDRINVKRPANGLSEISDKLKISKSTVEAYFNRDAINRSTISDSSAKKSEKGELAASVAQEIKK